MEEKEYYIGIDYGTSNSCIGIYMNSTVVIAPNTIGERTIPSLVAFTDKEIFAGEDILYQKIEENNLIYEVKRFIGLDYNEFLERDFSKSLNYDVINQDGKPKIKVILKGKEQYYSAEEISAMILKKIVRSAEDFINEMEQGIKIGKAVITVPVHFTDKQKEAINAAARLADIEIERIINEPTAAALAYGLGISSEKTDKRQENEKLTYFGKSIYDVAPSANDKFKSQENIIVFDLGGGTFDISILNLRKADGDADFEVIGTNGDNHLGGSDFDNKIVDYYIKKFCKDTGKNEANLRKDHKACKRLRIKCEAAKKILSERNEAFISVEDFFEGEDFYEKITKYEFEKICKDLFEKIELIINDLLNEIGFHPEDIESVVLIGGATRMTGIRDILRKKFGERKIKDSINPDEAVAFGAALQCAKLEKKDESNFTLQDIIPYNLGIGVMNPNQNEINKGELMYTFIKKYSKIPTNSDEKAFKVTLNDRIKDININVYEGNNKYVEKNTKLDVITIKDVKIIGEIEYKLKFFVDVSSKLTVDVSIDSLNYKKKYIMRQNVTNAFFDKGKKKIKINKSKSIIPINSVIQNIGNIKSSLYSSTNLNDKLEKLIDCSYGYEQLIKNYITFSKNNDYVIEKIYLYTKQLFYVYSDRIIFNDDRNISKNILKKNNVPEIINKIKIGMSLLISVAGYVSDLLDIFISIRENSKDVFYKIFLNFMELMNNEGIKRLKNNKFKRYFSKLYFEKAFCCYKKYVQNDDLKVIDIEIKRALDEQHKINTTNLDEINSFAKVIESLAKGKEFLIGKSGFTLQLKQIEKLENIEKLSVDELRDIFDLFQNMADSYDKKEKCLEEAYCIANLIKIIYTIYHDKNIDKLMEYIYRLEDIMEGREDEKYAWYEEIKKINELIKEKDE